jgi:hypothetical protein
MFDDESVVRFCIDNKITVRQYFFLYLIWIKDFQTSSSLARKYVNLVEPFPQDEVDDLVEKGFIEDFNSPSQMLPEMYMIPDSVADKLFLTEDRAEELWNSYPVTFPLYDKNSKFLARTGGNKDDILDLYRKKVKSLKKHTFVLEQLRAYIAMVSTGEINGMKIVDFIRQEIWDSVSEIKRKGNTQDFSEDA